MKQTKKKTSNIKWENFLYENFNLIENARLRNIYEKNNIIEKFTKNRDVKVEINNMLEENINGMYISNMRTCKINTKARQPLEFKSYYKGNGRTCYYLLKNSSIHDTDWKIKSNKDIFKGIDNIKELPKKAYAYILNGNSNFKYIIDTIDNKKIRFARISAKEYVYGRNNKNLKGNEYQEKMRTAPSIDDLIEHARIKYHSPLNHPNKLFPNGYNNYQGTVEIDNNIFRYIVRVGKTKDYSSIFYDVSLELLRKKKTDNKVLGTQCPSLKSASNNTSISKNNANVNI